MAQSRRLTQKEIAQRKAKLHEWSIQRDSDPKFLKIKSWLKDVFKSDDDALCGFLARKMIEMDDLLKENERLVELLNRKISHAHSLSTPSIPAYVKRNIANFISEHYPGDEAVSIYAQVIAKEQQASKRGRKAADALHSKPGGSRDKRQAIIDIWATGKYSSRDICAEEECNHLQMSFSAARRALRNTPKPI
jgi:hypothetical protein